jgi:hypothetical protein
MNDEFFQRIDNNVYRLVHPIIRGNREEFYEIPYDDVCVKDYHNFIETVVKPLRA